MLHFSCDVCGRQLADQRFVVRLESYPAFDPDLIEDSDLDVDHLQQVADELQLEDEPPTEPERLRVLRFDLCPTCHERFLLDPLGREAKRRVRFSQN
jgi:hypothetical protein